MARFIFELQAVLEQRQRLERQRQRAVAEIERQRVAVEQRARQIQTRLAGGRRAMRGSLSRQGEPVAMDEVRMQATASLHDLIALQRVALEMAGVQQRLVAARQVLMQAVVARKAVERLRARRLEQWRLEMSRREAAAMDDLTVMRHGRTDGVHTGAAA